MFALTLDSRLSDVLGSVQTARVATMIPAADESVHTIWCPPSWTPEQTWEHISRGHLVPTDGGEENGQWVSMLIEGYADDGKHITAGTLKKVVD